jgi:hypothetical protein
MQRGYFLGDESDLDGLSERTPFGETVEIYEDRQEVQAQRNHTAGARLIGEGKLHVADIDRVHCLLNRFATMLIRNWSTFTITFRTCWNPHA